MRSTLFVVAMVTTALVAGVFLYRMTLVSPKPPMETLDLVNSPPGLNDFVDADLSEWSDKNPEYSGTIATIEGLSVKDRRLNGTLLMNYKYADGSPQKMFVGLGAAKVIRRSAPIVIGQEITVWEAGDFRITDPPRISPRFVLFGPSLHE